MTIFKDHSMADRDLTLLAPFFLARVEAAIAECKGEGWKLWVVEGYRSPERQNWLYAFGRTKDGTIKTKARAWESLHNYGLAVDICGGSNKAPVWTMPWDKIKRVFELNGLISLAPFEQAHFEINGGFKTKQLKDFAHSDGLDAVWAIVEKAVTK